jgi:hypothetical protein
MKIVAEPDLFLKLISPEARGEIFGEKTNGEIWDELKSTKENRTIIVDEVDARIADEIAKGFKGITTRSQASKIQAASGTFKSVAIKRYINKRELLSCPIDDVEICECFRSTWGPTQRQLYEAEPDSLFYLHRNLPGEDVAEAMNDYMLSEDKIRHVIRSRDELSACGNDGISYTMMKAGGAEAAKFMKCIIKVTIGCDRVMDSWDEGRTALVCKKEDREDPTNGRSITITNCVYRVDTCLMVRAFQEMNLQRGIDVDARKDFVKKPNRCGEHGRLLNELFQDAERKNKDLIVTVIDFSDAFGCISHDLIMSTLKQLNFPI